MSKMSYILIIFAVIVISTGQIMLKYASKNISIQNNETFNQIIVGNIKPLTIIVFAIIIYLIAMLAWIQALRSTPLSIAYLFMSISFIIVPLAATFIFNESLPRYYIPGMSMIVIGLILISRG